VIETDRLGPVAREGLNPDTRIFTPGSKTG
jgi:hypothetical protein